MKIALANVTICRDAMCKIGKTVWPWEVPVLEAMYGEGMIQINGETDHEVDHLPDANVEYGRLAAAFGVDGNGTKVPYVELAYGRGRAGIMALSDVMSGSKSKQNRKPKEVKPTPPKMNEPKESDGEVDPLG